MILLIHTSLVPLLSDTQSDQIDLLGTLVQSQSVCVYEDEKSSHYISVLVYLICVHKGHAMCQTKSEVSVSAISTWIITG